MHIVFMGLFAFLGIALLALTVYGVLDNRRVAREAVRLTGAVVSSLDETTRDKQGYIKTRLRYSTVEATRGGAVYTMNIPDILPEGTPVPCILDRKRRRLLREPPNSGWRGESGITAGSLIMFGMGLAFSLAGSAGLLHAFGAPRETTIMLIKCTAIVFCSGVIVFEIVSLRNRARAARRYVGLDGEIVDMRKDWMPVGGTAGGRRMNVYSPEYRFAYKGKEYVHTSQVMRSSRVSMRRGDAVRVLFRPDTGESVLRDDFKSLNRTSVVFLAAGIGFLALFLAVL